MGRISTLFTLATFALFLAFSFNNCSEVGFKQDSKSTDGTAAGPDPNDPGGGTTPPGGGGGGTTPPGGGGGTTPPGGGGGTTPPGGGGGTTPPGGGGGTTPPPPTGIRPKVSFVGPPCVRGTPCIATFKLDKAYDRNVDFDWKTDDNAYKTANNPPFGQAGVHYVSTSGHITFVAGETEKQISIQNINQQATSILIQVLMSKCQFGGGPIEGCLAYFQ